MDKKNRLVAHNELVRLESIQARNFKGNLQRLQQDISVFDELFYLAADLFYLMKRPLLKQGEERKFCVLTNLYSLIMQDLMKGMVNILNGYVTDSSFHSRRILESVARSGPQISGQQLRCNLLPQKSWHNRFTRRELK